MARPTKGKRLGSGPAHQSLMLSNLASDLFRHGRIRTTEAKARTLRPYAEKMITKAKRGDLHARRQVLAKLRDRDVVAYLFEDVAPRFIDRHGGYTRIVKLGPRQGDHAPMALIELVDRGGGSGEDLIEESRQRRSRGIFGRRRRQSEPVPQDIDTFDAPLGESEDTLDESIELGEETLEDEAEDDTDAAEGAAEASDSDEDDDES